MEKHRKTVAGGILPEIVKLRLIRLKACVHRQQFDSLEFEVAMSLVELILPTGLGRIQGQEAYEFPGVLVDVARDVSVRYPEP
jgi:hypothetical protein